MGKFVFRLQALLNVKVQIESSLKNELGKAIQELERQKGLLKHIEQEKEEYSEGISKKSSQGVCVAELREYNSYLFFLRDRIKLKKEDIKAAQINVDIHREKLIKVVQERKMLEKLKEKKYELFLSEQNKEDQKRIDELVSFNYNTT
ncbi:MAG: flagellar export protein FliJ [Clostridiaceae bacterium]|nr:flagellar export protein FliJ [Clostridiaceae bacterium]